MQNGVIITTPLELQTLIQDAVNVAVQKQFSLPQKVDPLPLHQYMDIEQACQYLNIAKPTIYGYVCKQTIPHIKKGRKLFFRVSDIEQWLDDGRKNTKQEIINNYKTTNKWKK